MFSSVIAGAISTTGLGFGFGFGWLMLLLGLVEMVEVWRRSRVEETDCLGACLRGGRTELGGRRGMGIMASLRGRGEWLVRTRV